MKTIAAILILFAMSRCQAADQRGEFESRTGMAIREGDFKKGSAFYFRAGTESRSGMTPSSTIGRAGHIRD